MVNWLAKIKTGDLHKAYKNGEMDIEEVARGYAERLRNIPPGLVDYELTNIIDKFDIEVTDVDYFDYVLQDLYDWADYGHRLWVDTFSTPAPATRPDARAAGGH